MDKFKIVILYLLLLFSNRGYSQEKEFHSDEHIWLGYFNQTKIAEHFGLWTDVHLRTSDQFVGEVRQLLGRIGVSFFQSKDFRFTLGYAFVNQTSGENRNAFTENRPWQQMMWLTHRNKTKITQWLRFEQRFRKVESNEVYSDRFNFRLRFNSLIQIPIQKKDDPKYYWVLNDEVFVNFGKEIVYNTFDQNRFFTGLAYHHSHSLIFQLGYMNILQQGATGNAYELNHCIRFFVFQNLNF